MDRDIKTVLELFYNGELKGFSDSFDVTVRSDYIELCHFSKVLHLYELDFEIDKRICEENSNLSEEEIAYKVLNFEIDRLIYKLKHNSGCLIDQLLEEISSLKKYKKEITGIPIYIKETKDWSTIEGSGTTLLTFI